MNSTYSSAVRELLAENRLPDLGPGRPNDGMRQLLAELTPQKLVAGEQVRSQEFAAACLAGLWLYHDFLDESQTISQDIAGPSGSFWHGIMHRREPDPSNAAYWFRRVRQHPVFESLGAAAKELAEGKVAVPSPWDAFWFIDFCESSRGKDDLLARQIQMAEWRLFFDYCYRQA